MAIPQVIKSLVGTFAKKRILVVGDLMLDRYVSGTVARISPEAPVPVVQVTREQSRPGGAANVAANIRSLGGAVVMAGVVGEDAAGRELAGVLAERGVSTAAVVADARVRTTVKTRVMAERQQIVRVDHDNLDGIHPACVDALCKRIAGAIPEVDGVIIEDYSKGVVCQRVVDTIMRHTRGTRVLTGLDPKDNRALRFSSLTLATPNFLEACIAAELPHKPLGDGDPRRNPLLIKAGEVLVRRWNCTLLIITLGPHGMYLVTRNERPLHIPTEAREVFDVSGAGDTVIATAMLAMVSGAGHRQAAMLANVAAGVVVAKIGTATCSADELLANWRDRKPAGR